MTTFQISKQPYSTPNAETKQANLPVSTPRPFAHSILELQVCKSKKSDRRGHLLPRSPVQQKLRRRHYKKERAPQTIVSPDKSNRTVPQLQQLIKLLSWPTHIKTIRSRFLNWKFTPLCFRTNKYKRVHEDTYKLLYVSATPNLSKKKKGRMPKRQICIPRRPKLPSNPSWVNVLLLLSWKHKRLCLLKAKILKYPVRSQRWSPCPLSKFLTCYHQRWFTRRLLQKSTWLISCFLKIKLLLFPPPPRISKRLRKLRKMLSGCSLMIRSSQRVSRLLEVPKLFYQMMKTRRCRLLQSLKRVKIHLWSTNGCPKKIQKPKFSWQREASIVWSKKHKFNLWQDKILNWLKTNFVILQMSTQ